MNTPMINIKNLYKAFGSNEILRGIDLKLDQGENVVILGKSGIGKSVLTKCIVGLLPYDRGDVEIMGKNIDELDISGFDQIRKKMGYLFQGGALYDSMTVRENLEFPLLRSRFMNRSEEDIEKKVLEALENVGLKETIDMMPAQLSGGMKKRIGLARTLILEPEIIFYDEPTTGLDPVTSNEISNLIIDIQKTYKTSSIIITHDLKCAQKTGDRLKLMKDGKFYAEGTYEEMQNSSDKEVRMYFK
ncbi:ABC transporter ATP-binding protein [Salinivirga cyanobacteriivorans]